MGGSAFKQAAAPGHPTLTTPRMTPGDYTRLKDTYLEKLQAYFFTSDAKVAVLKEAPEKQSYGDLDFIVGLDATVDFMDLATKVGATALICHGDKVCTLGVSRDSTSSPERPVVYRNVYGTGTDTPTVSEEFTPEEYSQIDIEVIAADLIDWHLFYSAYGDLNSMLGHIVNNLGFTVTDRGLWLRMKELDASKGIERAIIPDSLGKIFLSNKPKKVMRFLGLSIGAWNDGFATLDELFAWLSACRLIDPAVLQLKRDKAHDRVREENRPVYRRFFLEYLPAHLPGMDEGYTKEDKYVVIDRLRPQYLREALDFFDIRAAYKSQHTRMANTINDAIAANLLRPVLEKHSAAQGKKLGELVRAMRRWVLFDEAGRPEVAKEAHTDAESQLEKFLGEDGTTLRDEEAVENFVRLNWLKVKELERAGVKKARREDGDGAEVQEGGDTR